MTATWILALPVVMSQAAGRFLAQRRQGDAGRRCEPAELAVADDRACRALVAVEARLGDEQTSAG